MDEYIREAMNGKSRSGKTQLLKYLRGSRITRQESIKAKCFDCDGMGDSGECDLEHCALYPYSPFKTNSKSVQRAAQRTGD